MQPTYENVYPLADEVRVHRRTVTVRFVCPMSSEVRQGEYTVRESALEVAAERVGRSLLSNLRYSIYGFVRSIFGHGIVGRVLADLAGELARSAQTAPRDPEVLDEGDVRMGVVGAFLTVQGLFAWEAEGGRWVAASCMAERLPPLQQHLHSHPVTHPYDLEVLARMLWEVARADGSVSQQERDLLTEYTEQAVAHLAARPSLTAAELRETSEGETRLSLLLIAWVIALVDESESNDERSMLFGWSQSLGLGPAQVMWVRSTAQQHVLMESIEKMHTWGGHDVHARDELYALAERIGVSREDAERAEAAYRRRAAER